LRLEGRSQALAREQIDGEKHAVRRGVEVAGDYSRSERCVDPVLPA
jgi:hypothetical protein